MKKLIILTIVLMVLVSNLSFAHDTTITEDSFLELTYNNNYTDENGVSKLVLNAIDLQGVLITFDYYDSTFEGFETFEYWYNFNTDCLYIFDPINNVVVFDDMDL